MRRTPVRVGLVSSLETAKSTWERASLKLSVFIDTGDGPVVCGISGKSEVFIPVRLAEKPFEEILRVSLTASSSTCWEERLEIMSVMVCAGIEILPLLATLAPMVVVKDVSRFVEEILR